MLKKKQPERSTYGLFRRDASVFLGTGIMEKECYIRVSKISRADAFIIDGMKSSKAANDAPIVGISCGKIPRHPGCYNPWMS